MFETVAPAAGRRPTRSALYEGLTFSLLVHAAAGILYVGAYVWQVTFPAQSPAFSVAFVLETPAPPPPPPPPPKPPQAEPVKTPPVKEVPEAIVAPVAIPETIPLLKPEPVQLVDLTSANGVVGGIEGGSDHGVVGGTGTGGVQGGTPGSVAPPPPPPDGRVHFARDEKLPLITVQQDYPSYPEVAQKHGWEDELVVRYVIGKDGRIKDVKVIEAPTRELFVKGTLDAIRAWRFKPFLKDGQRVEVVHELTIYYRLTSHAT